MWSTWNITKYSLVLLYFLSAVLVHFRGKRRLRFVRQLGDHSTLMGPINALMYRGSAVPKQVFFEPSKFQYLEPLQANWQTIRDEGLALLDQGNIKGTDRGDDLGFHTFFKRGWKRFYLKWYDQPHASAAALCPKTCALLAEIPQVKAAAYTLLPPGSVLGAHRDPYAGSLRYHLGLKTPNSDACAIVVDGQTYGWRDGEGVVFDETFIHEAYNRTDITRLILFCDIERPMKTRLGKAINHFFGFTLMKAAASPNEETDRTGMINRIFRYILAVKTFGQNLKAKNRRLYYVAKYTLFLGLFYLIFLRHWI
ncbi:MAG: aspartyl/asparaginyl beta-hydroxylase domain-containing protein [Acidobacteria bacterium]|nr:aspartyl/asparaginyl beta-hydroxylase domain-containing protein [Acidobacteriota bacterium]MCB9396563.1 aspartyl/asparaginyl beta-hydroxylase domain-containing protein [Acidobacteriota bacterium]